MDSVFKFLNDHRESILLFAVGAVAVVFVVLFILRPKPITVADSEKGKEFSYDTFKDNQKALGISDALTCKRMCAAMGKDQCKAWEVCGAIGPGCAGCYFISKVGPRSDGKPNPDNSTSAGAAAGFI